MTVAILKPRADLTPVQRLQADAREDYAHHNRPETAAAAREQHGQTIANAQAGGRKYGGRQ